MNTKKKLTWNTTPESEAKFHRTTSEPFQTRIKLENT